MDDDYLQVLRERHAYLATRINGKKIVGWETTYDERERAALGWAIKELIHQEDDGA